MTLRIPAGGFAFNWRLGPVLFLFLDSLDSPLWGEAIASRVGIGWARVYTQLHRVAKKEKKRSGKETKEGNMKN